MGHNKVVTNTKAIAVPIQSYYYFYLLLQCVMFRCLLFMAQVRTDFSYSTERLCNKLVQWLIVLHHMRDAFYL